VERLNRFKLRTKAEIETLAWSMVAVRGDALDEPVAPSGGVVLAVAARGDAPAGWDLLGPEASIPAGVRECDPESFETLRILAGIPRMGHEIDETTTPAETGMVAESASFTKGCYTGQELVARVDSRGGRAPRRVVRLVAAVGSAPSTGSSLVREGVDVGRLTSVASDGGGGVVALGLLARAVETPCDLSVGTLTLHGLEVGPSS
jgi:folate-binding protein YgfZ